MILKKKKTDRRFNWISLILTLPAMLLFSLRRRRWKLAAAAAARRSIIILHVCRCRHVADRRAPPSLFLLLRLGFWILVCPFRRRYTPYGYARTSALRAGFTLTREGRNKWTNRSFRERSSGLSLPDVPNRIACVFAAIKNTPGFVGKPPRTTGMMPDVCVVSFVDAAPRQQSPAWRLGRTCRPETLMNRRRNTCPSVRPSGRTLSFMRYTCTWGEGPVQGCIKAMSDLNEFIAGEKNKTTNCIKRVGPSTSGKKKKYTVYVCRTSRNRYSVIEYNWYTRNKMTSGPLMRCVS